MTNIEDLNSAIDNLTLDMLILLEKNIESNLSLELTIKDGNYHMAKARYIMGHKNVSALQLPNEESSDINAMTLVNEIEPDDKDSLVKNQYTLTINNTATSKNDSCEQQNPMKWFGILVPQDLRMAQSKFFQACQYIVDVSNISRQLNTISENLLFAINVKNRVVVN